MSFYKQKYLKYKKKFLLLKYGGSDKEGTYVSSLRGKKEKIIIFMENIMRTLEVKKGKIDEIEILINNFNIINDAISYMEKTKYMYRITKLIQYYKEKEIEGDKLKGMHQYESAITSYIMSALGRLTSEYRHKRKQKENYNFDDGHITAIIYLIKQIKECHEKRNLIWENDTFDKYISLFLEDKMINSKISNSLSSTTREKQPVKNRKNRKNRKKVKTKQTFKKDKESNEPFTVSTVFNTEVQNQNEKIEQLKKLTTENIKELIKVNNKKEEMLTLIKKDNRKYKKKIKEIDSLTKKEKLTQEENIKVKNKSLFEEKIQENNLLLKKINVAGLTDIEYISYEKEQNDRKWDDSRTRKFLNIVSTTENISLHLPSKITEIKVQYMYTGGYDTDFNSEAIIKHFNKRDMHGDIAMRGSFDIFENYMKELLKSINVYFIISIGEYLIYFNLKNKIDLKFIVIGKFKNKSNGKESTSLHKKDESNEPFTVSTSFNTEDESNEPFTVSTSFNTEDKMEDNISETFLSDTSKEESSTFSSMFKDMINICEKYQKLKINNNFFDEYDIIIRPELKNYIINTDLFIDTIFTSSDYWEQFLVKLDSNMLENIVIQNSEDIIYLKTCITDKMRQYFQREIIFSSIIENKFNILFQNENSYKKHQELAKSDRMISILTSDDPLWIYYRNITIFNLIETFKYQISYYRLADKQNENVIIGLRSRSYIDFIVKLFVRNNKIFSKIETDVNENDGINENITTYIKEEFEQFYIEMFRKESKIFSNQLKLYDETFKDYLIKWIIIQCDIQYGNLKDEILSKNTITKNRLFENLITSIYEIR